MKNEFNLDLRAEILNMALMLESSIKQLITVCLEIEHPNPKAISNKSSSLSFKNKIDLLNDLEIISKKEHLNLLLFMEFRNQFLHNIECVSFVKAVELLGDDKGKQVLIFSDLPLDANLDSRYINGYKKLFENCLLVIKQIYDKRKENFFFGQEMFANLAEYTEFLFEVNENILHNIMTTCRSTREDDMSTAALKTKIQSIIIQGIKNLDSSEKYIYLRTKLGSLDIKKMDEILKWPKKKSG